MARAGRQSIWVRCAGIAADIFSDPIPKGVNLLAKIIFKVTPANRIMSNMPWSRLEELACPFSIIVVASLF